VDVKRFIELIQRRIRRRTKGKKFSVFSLFQRSRQQGFISSHEKLLSGKMPLTRRVGRVLHKWKNSRPDKYTPPRESKLTKRNIFLFCMAITCCILLFGFKGVLKNQLLKLDIFLLTNIKVTGCLKTTPDKIRDHALLKYNSRLFEIDPQKVAKRLEDLPWILRAKVTRKLPDTLVIDLQENIPKAMIQLGEKKELFYVGQQGVPFVQLTAGQDMDFPMITGLERVNNIEDLKEPLFNILQFLKETNKDDPNLPAQAVSQLHFHPGEGTILFLVDFPFPIFLGKDNIQMKYNRLKKVVGFIYKEQKKGMNINTIAYIRMDYSDTKVLVAHTAQDSQK